MAEYRNWSRLTEEESREKIARLLPGIKGLFVHVAKNAGTSIMEAIGPFDDVYDTVSRVGESQSDGHLCRRYIPKEEWDEKFSFAFVRNPYERMISAWLFCNRVYEMKIDFDFFMTIAMDARVGIMPHQHHDRAVYALYEHVPRFEEARYHALPMTHEHYDLDSVKFIGRFENLQADWAKILEQLDRPVVPLEKRNSNSNKPHYSAYYGKWQRLRAEEFYAEDCKAYGYKFESRV